MKWWVQEVGQRLLKRLSSPTDKQGECYGPQQMKKVNDTYNIHEGRQWLSECFSDTSSHWLSWIKDRLNGLLLLPLTNECLIRGLHDGRELHRGKHTQLCSSHSQVGLTSQSACPLQLYV